MVVDELDDNVDASVLVFDASGVVVVSCVILITGLELGDIVIIGVVDTVAICVEEDIVLLGVVDG